MDLRILGPLEVSVQGNQVQLGGARHRILLAILALEANRLVTVDKLVQSLWEENPPPTARGQVQICVSKVRRVLSATALRNAVVTRPAGYLLRAPADQLDALVFDDLAGQARTAAGAGQETEAAELLRSALRLWRGAPLADVPSAVVQAGVARLHERRLRILQERVRLDLRLGRHHELLPELRELTGEHPAHENLLASLMLALYRAGRQIEALDVYRTARAELIAEFGVEPGEELRRLEHAILSRSPELDLHSDAVQVAARVGPVPRQLPADITDLTGRADAARGLLTVLPADGAGSGLPVVAISGAGGVGKSTLAIHVAHRRADTFPDGQLYAKLSSGGRRLDPADVLTRFLGALGAGAVTGTVEDRIAEYRSRMADRRILVVLDDAVDEAQVLPLLPGSASCAVLTTSRSRLAGLAGARHITLTPLSDPDAAELLARIIGADRLRAEPAATRELVTLCGGLPLAVRIVGARLASRPHWRIGQLTERLRDPSRRLDEMVYGDLQLRATFRQDYLSLPEQGRRLLRRLAGLDAPVFPASVAAGLLGIDVSVGEELMAQLFDARLLDVKVDRATALYRFHSLVRPFAREMLAAEAVPATCAGGIGRRQDMSTA